MAKVEYLRNALVAAAALGVFALTAHADAGDASPTTTAQPAAGAAAPHAVTPSAEPYRYQPRYPREDLPCNPPGKWEVYPSPTTKDLHAVDFIDANNGWAVGRGVILRYRNGTWTEEPGHDAHNLGDIDMVSLTDGWAVGRDGNDDIWKIWRWDGSSWKIFQNVTGAIYCIDMIDANHGWIGGNGYFLRFNGTTWEWGGSAPNTVNGIEMFSDTSGWAVGAPGIVMRRSDNTWQTVPAGSDWMLAEVSMTDVNNGWATGYKRYVEKGLIVRCVGGIWTEYKTYDEARSIAGIDFYAADFGWCCGWTNTAPPYGAFLAFSEGSLWYLGKPPTDKGLLGVKVLNKNSAWTVGETGVILKYKPNVNISPASLGRIKTIYR